jgi:hypothetical protein
MGDGNGFDDGQAEPKAVPRAVKAMERLEKAFYFFAHDRQASIAHRQHCTARFHARGDIDPPTGDIVPHGVVDEVRREPVEEAWGTPGPGRAEGSVDLDAFALCIRMTGHELAGGQ